METPRIAPARCKDKLREDMLGNPDYVAEEKLDGSRFMLYIDMGSTKFYSRRDFPRIDRAANVPHLAKHYPRLVGTVLDGEAIRSNAKKLGDTTSIMLSLPTAAHKLQNQKGFIQFHVFDILFHNGEDCRRYPLHRRRELLEQVVAEMDNVHVHLVPQRPATMDFYEDVVARGGEGIVVKNIHNGYGIGWAKVKKFFDVSCIIGGFKPGEPGGKYEHMVGAIQLGVFDSEGEVYETPDFIFEVGFASGMTDALRQKMTDDPDAYIGRVIDVYTQELTPNRRLRHPRFHRFRDDVDPATCTLKKIREDLAKAAKKKGRK